LSSQTEEFGSVVVAGGSDQSSGLDSTFSFHWVHANQVQGNVFERGQIVRGMARGRAAFALLLRASRHLRDG
jgi:hypothetical protein